MFSLIPLTFFEPCRQGGHIERMDYRMGGCDKYALVYVPWGYDGSKPCPVLYLMHGGSGTPNDWFGRETEHAELINILDHMTLEGHIAPTIVVTPSYLTSDETVSDEYLHAGDMSMESLKTQHAQTELFQQELTRVLIPMIESRYHTYARSVDAEGIRASRDRRAFGGYSMGSACTWNALIHSLAAFRHFLPMSGDCWALGVRGGGSDPQQTAAFLASRISAQGFGAEDVNIYAYVGASGAAYAPMDAMLSAMEQEPVFRIRKTRIETGPLSQAMRELPGRTAPRLISRTPCAHPNVHYTVISEFPHDLRCGYHYLYNALPMFFPPWLD